MSAPTFTVHDTAIDGHAVRVVSFDILGGQTTPDAFVAATADLVDALAGPFGVVLDGRGPVWGYAMLVHAAHASRFVATHDPRVGVVVVQSHVEGVRPGQVLAMPAFD